MGINMPRERKGPLERLQQSLAIAEQAQKLAGGVKDLVSDISKANQNAKATDAARQTYRQMGYTVGDDESLDAMERRLPKLPDVEMKKYEASLKKSEAPSYAVSQEKVGNWLADGAKLVPPGTRGATEFSVTGPDGNAKMAAVLFPPKVAKAESAGGLTVPGSNDVRARLDKQPAEIRSKVGLIASALGAMTGYEEAYSSGQRPEYTTPDTPLVGRFKSDTDLTRTQRVLNEAVGRLQSGGVIGGDELNTFNAMGPRPGDSEDQRIKKLADQRKFLEDRLIAFGFKPEEIDQVGFDPARLGYDDKSIARRNAISKDVTTGGDPTLPAAQADVQRDPYIEATAKANGITYEQAQHLLQRRK